MENAAKTLRHYIELVETANTTIVSVRFTPDVADAPENQFNLTLPGFPDDDAIGHAVRRAVSEQLNGQPCKLIWQRIQQSS